MAGTVYADDDPTHFSSPSDRVPAVPSPTLGQHDPQRQGPPDRRPGTLVLFFLARALERRPGRRPHVSTADLRAAHYA